MNEWVVFGKRKPKLDPNEIFLDKLNNKDQ